MKKALIITCILLLKFTVASNACATFKIVKGDTIVIGHNLDERYDMTGLIHINKRGIIKESLSWYEIMKGKKKDLPHIKWTSKYGSVTYNPFSKEFPDGGMNEVGLYIGEMSLMETQHSVNDNLPTLFAGLMMQYMLDQFETIDQVINCLHTEINIDNISLWHFFVADKSGNSAVIEYLEGKLVVKTKETLPYPLLCNRIYETELDSMKLYKEFGGTRNFCFDSIPDDTRFILGSKMLNEFKKQPIIDYSFNILESFNYGGNKWRLVFDATNLRVYFNTERSRQTKYLDFSSFDFSNRTPAMVFDINTDVSGNVSDKFITYTHETNKKYLDTIIKELLPNFFIRNIFFGGAKRRMISYPKNTFIKNESSAQLNTTN